MSERHISILGWLGFALTVAAMLVGITLYVTKANADQDKQLTQHEVRIEALEEIAGEQRSQRNLLEQIWEAVKR